MKPNYYVFLDIDGVFMDWKFIKSLPSTPQTRMFEIFNPKSVEALNFLTQHMNEKYSVHLVISSTWRHDMNRTKAVFANNGIITKNKLTCTPIFYDPARRGEEIIYYLKKNGFNKQKDDYLIIDDESFDFDKYFPKSKIIKTNIFNNSLNMEMINKYLQKQKLCEYK